MTYVADTAQFEEAVARLEATYYRACTTPIGDDASTDQWRAARAALLSLFSKAAGELGQTVTETVDRLKQYATHLTFCAANRKKFVAIEDAVGDVYGGGYMMASADEPCDCGLDAALSAFQPGTGDTGQ